MDAKNGNTLWADAISKEMENVRSKEVDICMFLNSNHARDNVSCRSRNCFLICVNTALVQWFSKKQSTVVISVYGAEFVALNWEA